MVEHIGMGVGAEQCIRSVMEDNLKLMQSVDQPLKKQLLRFQGEEEGGDKYFNKIKKIFEFLVMRSKPRPSQRLLNL